MAHRPSAIGMSGGASGDSSRRAAVAEKPHTNLVGRIVAEADRPTFASAN